MPRQSAIKIDRVPTEVTSRTLVLTGTNSSTIATIQVSGTPGAVVQPSTTTWRIELRLSPGTNVVRISGLDIAGNVTESLRLEILLQALGQSQYLPRNVFDEFGVFLSLERLPGEKNLHYFNRLLNAGLFPSNTTLDGVIRAAARELSFQVQRAFLLQSPRDPDTLVSRAVDGAITIGQVYLDLESQRLQTVECHRIEPATQSITLTRRPVDSAELRIFTLEGDEIPVDTWTLDLRAQRVDFHDHALNAVQVHAHFRYVERILLRGRTLGQVLADINAVMGPDGIPLFLATGLLDDTTPAEDLLPTPQPVSIATFGIEFEASPVRIRELLDQDFQEANLNDRGHAVGTKLEVWARRINTQSRIVWDAVFLGESVWEPLGSQPRLGALPHLTDAEKGHWRCLTPTDTTRYTLKDFRANDGICPTDGTPLEYHGVLPLQFQSGTGTRDDLSVLRIVAVRTEE